MRNMTRARARRMVAVVGMLAVVLAACGSDDPEPTDDATDDTADDAEDDADDGDDGDDGDDDAEEEPAASGWEPTEDITFGVPYSAGGGFDTYSRLLAQVMQENHLPDGVSVVVENAPTVAEGFTTLYTSPADGYNIGILPMPAAAAQEIQFPEIAQWETSEFTMLGSVDENAYVVYVRSDGDIQTVDDLLEGTDLRAITVERGSSSSLAAATAIQTLELDAELTFGAEGSQEAATALLRGDVDFIVYGTTDVTGFVDSGDLTPLLFLGTPEQRTPSIEWLTDLPGLEDLGYGDEAGAVTELRLIVAPPGLGDEERAYLENLLAETMADPDFIALAEEAGRPIVPRDAESARTAAETQITAMERLIPELAEQDLI